MENNRNHYFLEIQLSISAGYAGVFPEAEMIIWLRSAVGDVGMGKLMVVLPQEPLESTSLKRLRTFQVAETKIKGEDVRSLIDVLGKLDFPGRELHIKNTADPASIWWGMLKLRVNLDGKRGILEVDLGPDGIVGDDSERLRTFFVLLMQTANVSNRWSELLSGTQ